MDIEKLFETLPIYKFNDLKFADLKWCNHNTHIYVGLFLNSKYWSEIVDVVNVSKGDYKNYEKKTFNIEDVDEIFWYNVGWFSISEYCEKQHPSILFGRFNEKKDNKFFLAVTYVIDMFPDDMWHTGFRIKVYVSDEKIDLITLGNKLGYFRDIKPGDYDINVVKNMRGVVFG
jgi:hypothetical protein